VLEHLKELGDGSLSDPKTYMFFVYMFHTLFVENETH
jgi:hypothetical protein